VSLGDRQEINHLEITTLPLRGAKVSSSGWVIVVSDMTSDRENARKIAMARDQEQRRIGKDLHDGLCQQLVSISFAAGNLLENLEDDRLIGYAKRAEEIRRWIGDSIVQTRSLAHGLLGY
jgi:signal transduction histidine kinase